MEINYHIGQRVRLVANIGEMTAQAGDLARVVGIDREATRLPIEIEVDGQFSVVPWNVDPDEIEPVEEMAVA